MDFSRGRSFLAIPGPSVIPDAVLGAMHRPAVNIYEGPLVELTNGLLPDLKRIVGTEGEAMMYIANGHGGWEASLANLFGPGDRVLVLESGRFAVGWGEMARGMGVEARLLKGRPRRAVDPAAVEEALRADTGQEIAAVLVVQIDTATGVLNDIPAIRAAMDAAGHPALLLVDCIASTGCVPYAMDEWGVDVTVTACQKGLMTPPGLAFVFAGERAMARREARNCASPYWDWLPRARPERAYQRFAGTAPVQHLFGLRCALDMIFAEGLEAVYGRHRRIAAGVRAAVEAWGADGAMELNIAEAAERSDSVTTILTPGFEAEALRRVLEDDLEVTLGIGLGLDVPAFRIGHMGHVNEATILGTLGAVELGLRRLGMKAGGGVEAAVAAMG